MKEGIVLHLMTVLSMPKAIWEGHTRHRLTIVQAKGDGDRQHLKSLDCCF